MAKVRLLGPDLNNHNLIVEGLATSMTILDLKEQALKVWPPGARPGSCDHARPVACALSDAPC
jgi:hypothetical protein